MNRGLPSLELTIVCFKTGSLLLDRIDTNTYSFQLQVEHSEENVSIPSLNGDVNSSLPLLWLVKGGPLSLY